VRVEERFPDPTPSTADFSAVHDVNLAFSIPGEGAADPPVYAAGGKIDFAGGGQDVTRKRFPRAESVGEAPTLSIPERHPDSEALRPQNFRSVACTDMAQFHGNLFTYATPEPPGKLFPASLDGILVGDNF
jgi:hypothetical protein